MTSASCKQFREEWRIGVEHPHLAECAECSRFAEVLQRWLPRAEEAQPVPELGTELQQRLLSIPQAAAPRTAASKDRSGHAALSAIGSSAVDPSGGETRHGIDSGCPDLEALYTAARAAAHGGTVRPALARHVEKCSDCASRMTWLQEALAPPKPSLPKGLRQRLLAIPRSGLSAWATDTRVAAAVCYLLTVALLLAAGDASTLYRRAAERVSTPAAQLAEAGENGSKALWRLVIVPSRERIQWLGNYVEEGLVRTADRVLPEDLRRKLRSRERGNDTEGDADERAGIQPRDSREP